MLFHSTESTSTATDALPSPTKSTSSLSSAISKLLRYKSSSANPPPDSPTFTPYSSSNQLQIGLPSLTHSSLLVYDELNPPDSKWGYREEYDESCDTSLIRSSGHCTPFDNRSETNSSVEGCEDGGVNDDEMEVLNEDIKIELVEEEEVSRWSSTDSSSHESSNEFENRGEKIVSIVTEEPFEFEGV